MRSVVAAVLTGGLLLFMGVGVATARYDAGTPVASADPASSDVALHLRAASEPAVSAGADTNSDVALYLRAASEPAVSAGADEVTGAVAQTSTAAVAPAVADDGLAGFVYALIGVAGGLALAAAGYFGMRTYQHHHVSGLA